LLLLLYETVLSELLLILPSQLCDATVLSVNLLTITFYQ